MGIQPQPELRRVRQFAEAARSKGPFRLQPSGCQRRRPDRSQQILRLWSVRIPEQWPGFVQPDLLVTDRRWPGNPDVTRARQCGERHTESVPSRGNCGLDCRRERTGNSSGHNSVHRTQFCQPA